MRVKVLFFGATADIAGKREADISSADNFAVKDAFARLVTSYPKLAGHKLKFAVNQEYVAGEHILRDGDELAIFTAVSGG